MIGPNPAPYARWHSGIIGPIRAASQGLTRVMDCTRTPNAGMTRNEVDAAKLERIAARSLVNDAYTPWQKYEMSWWQIYRRTIDGNGARAPATPQQHAAFESPDVDDFTRNALVMIGPNHARRWNFRKFFGAYFHNRHRQAVAEKTIPVVT